jgi:hypothetical protein
LWPCKFHEGLTVTGFELLFSSRLRPVKLMGAWLCTYWHEIFCILCLGEAIFFF